MKNPWSERNFFVKNYIPDNISIVDFGCGNKEILDFCRPKKYLGIDLVDTADLILDLNKNFELNEVFDLGLLLGVLEYIENPNFTLENIKKFAKTFVILTLPVKIKKEWRQAFTEDSIKELLNIHFKNLKHVKHGRYLISVGETQ